MERFRCSGSKSGEGRVLPTVVVVGGDIREGRV